MRDFYIQTEPKLFCLLILIFVYIFRTRNFRDNSKDCMLLYLFTGIEITASAVCAVSSLVLVRDICMAVCAISGFMALYFGCRYVWSVILNKTAPLKNVWGITAGVIGAVICIGAVYFRINAESFLLILSVVAFFTLEQYNKIRVDNLTKLYNRYGMDCELREQLRQYKRENTDSFYIISCDLDNFKHINDTWGHLEGDRALVLVAGVLSKIGKRFDSAVFRIGGDEFIIITDTSEEGLAIEVTDAIKAEFDKIEFRDDFDIKMSIGVSLYDGVTTIDELLNNADKKMYEAKRKGN